MNTRGSDAQQKREAMKLPGRVAECSPLRFLFIREAAEISNWRTNSRIANGSSTGARRSTRPLLWTGRKILLAPIHAWPMDATFPCELFFLLPAA